MHQSLCKHPPIISDNPTLVCICVMRNNCFSVSLSIHPIFSPWIEHPWMLAIHGPEIGLHRQAIGNWYISHGSCWLTAMQGQEMVEQSVCALLCRSIMMRYVLVPFTGAICNTTMTRRAWVHVWLSLFSTTLAMSQTKLATDCNETFVKCKRDQVGY